MKYIYKYGLNTKNTVTSTYDSLILTLNSSKIDGIKLDTIITKDEILIPIDTNINKKIGINTKKILEEVIDKIKKHNIGNKIKKQQIITIEEIFKLATMIKTSKIIFLNILDCYQNNGKIIDNLKGLEQTYHNINLYITSECNEIKEYLRTSSFKAKIGFTVNDLTQKQQFYIVDYKNIDWNYRNDKEIIITNINDKEDLKQINSIIKQDDKVIIELNDNLKL